MFDNFYAVHPHWKGVLRFSRENDSVVLLPFGNSGKYSSTDHNVISIDWDNHGSEGFFLKNGVYFSVDKSFINSLGDIEDIDYKYGVVDLGINSQEKLAAELLFLSHTTGDIDDISIEISEEIKNKSSIESCLIFITEMSKNVNSFRIVSRVADIYYEMGCFDQCIDFLIEAQRLMPDNAWPYFFKGKAFASKGDHLQAIASFKAGLGTINHDHITHETHNLIKGYFDSYASMSKEQKHAKEYVRSDLKTGRPCYKCIQVMLVKDEDDIIYSCLEAAYKNGVRLFAICENNSRDQTLQEIYRFRDVHTDVVVLIVNDPIVGYYQDAKTLGVALMAKTIFKRLGYDASWIIPVDADEILQFSLSDLDLLGVIELAENSDRKVILFNWFFAASTKVLENYSRSEKLQDVFVNSNGFGGVPVRKAAFKIDNDVIPEVGNHFVLNSVSRIDQVLFALDYKIVMIHYSTRSVAQMKRKIVNGYAALTAGKDLEGFGGHWRKEYQEYSSRGDILFYERLSDYINLHK